MSDKYQAAPVVALGTYRLAKRAAAVLVGLLHEPEWLTRVGIELTATGDPIVVAEVTSERFMRCFPSSIDGVPVHVREVKRPEKSGRTR